VSWGVDRVTVRYGGEVALADVSLTVAPGTTVSVVGGDGAGKSTLLRVLAGVLRPACGRVTAPPRHRLGYVSAGSGVYLDLTVAENLAFAAAAYGLRGDVTRSRAHRLLEVTDLAPARDRLAAQLSGGMVRKLAFACAALHAPDLLVMDEPTTGVDPVSRAELWRLVSGSVAAGTATLFTTTYVDEAARADHVLVLDRGRCLASGSPQAIRASVPGTVVRLDAPTADAPSWRRGRARHAWIGHGEVPADAVVIAPDLEDAVVVAALAAASEEVAA
jgi:ABC-2 type transport system ATP-binding protein